MMKDLPETNQNTFLKKYTSILSTVACLLSISLFAQNLVPNGSFEEGTNCPSFFGNLEEECLFWYNSILTESEEEATTPEWFFDCNEQNALNPPNVAFGYQEPADGFGYAGMSVFNELPTSPPNYREIIGVELAQPLMQGQSYILMFKLARLFLPQQGIASNNFGCKLTSYPHFLTNSHAVDNTSLFKIDSVITDTLNWLQVSFQFEADSNYSFIHFGNFYSDENTEFILDGDIGGFSYMILDDVSLNQTTLNSKDIKKPNFQIGPNPVRDQIRITGLNAINYSSFRIYNSNGRLVKVVDKNDDKQSIIDVSSLPQGLYLLHIQTPKSNYYETLIKI
jgi:hypothetical protein